MPMHKFWFGLEVPMLVQRSHCEHAVCQSLTGCILARSGEESLGVAGLLDGWQPGTHQDLVEVGLTEYWSYPTAPHGWNRNGCSYKAMKMPNDTRAAVSLQWVYNGDVYQGVAEDFNTAVLLYSQNDQARRRLLSYFKPRSLVIKEIHSFPPRKGQYDNSPSKKAYNKGYNDGGTARPFKVPDEFIEDSYLYGRYEQGHRAGTRRMIQGGRPSRSAPPVTRKRMSLV